MPRIPLWLLLCSHTAAVDVAVFDRVGGSKSNKLADAHYKDCLKEFTCGPVQQPKDEWPLRAPQLSMVYLPQNGSDLLLCQPPKVGTTNFINAVSRVGFGLSFSGCVRQVRTQLVHPGCETHLPRMNPDYPFHEHLQPKTKGCPYPERRMATCRPLRVVVVRDPYERARSFWLDKISTCFNGPYKWAVNAQILQAAGWRGGKNEVPWTAGKVDRTVCMTWPLFTRAMARATQRGKLNTLNMHISSQNVQCALDTIGYDLVIQLEDSFSKKIDLMKDWLVAHEKVVTNNTNADRVNSRANVAFRPKPAWTKETVDNLEAAFKEDLKILTWYKRPVLDGK
eukprot:Hpha_TRINITY_DN15899_c1_g4::TRINITY_DN15899_c1_g4_i7::g.190906::m.190906